jgi:hypothetical protein
MTTTMNPQCQAEDPLAFSATEYQPDAGFQWLSLNHTCTNFPNLNHPYLTVLFLSKSSGKCNFVIAYIYKHFPALMPD